MDERGKWRKGERKEERRGGLGKRMGEREGEREKKVKSIKGESHSHSGC